MAKWAADKKKDKQEAQASPTQPVQGNVWGVLIDGTAWLHKRLGRGRWIAGPRDGALRFATHNDADAMAWSLSIESYADGTIKAEYIGPQHENREKK